MVSKFRGNRKKQLGRKSRVGADWRKPRFGNLLRSDGRDGIARQVFVALKYSEYFEHNAVTTSPVGEKFRMNSMHSPRISAGGHSCMGFNSLAGLYQQYKVFGLKYKITFVNRIPTHQDGDPSTWIEEPHDMITCCVIPETSTTVSYGNINSAVEATGSKHIMLSREKTQGIVSGYVDLRRALGYTKSQFGDHACQAPVTGSPAEYAVLNILGQCPDDNSRISFSYHVEYTFYGKFFDKKKQLGNPIVP